MKIKQIILFFFAITLLASCSNAKKNPAWTINEVMVNNQNNYVDNYGERSGWIEIYNNTAKTQNLAGYFLTTDKNNPKMYAIPQGDVTTKVKPHQHVLFFADAEPFRGTYHTNFKLDPTKDNYIALYQVDGKTLVDEILIPAGTIGVDKTFGYETDGLKFDELGKDLAIALNRVTPSGNNLVVGENPKIILLKESDKNGIIITLTSMSVVFAGLLLLFLVFLVIGNIAKKITQIRAVKSGKLSAVRGYSNLSGEVLAAISAAVYEVSEDQHDIESTILTIKQVKRDYSPWSSKIYTLRETPRK